MNLKAINIFRVFLCLALIFFWLIEPVFSSDTLETNTEADSAEFESNTIYKAVAIAGVYYAASMFVLGNTWHKDKKVVPFHFYNDNRAYLQVDKFGHVFGAYFYSYIGYHSLLKLGLNHKEALIYGGSLGFFLQAPIEIMDGIHEGYGFSWGDMAANAIGSGIVIAQELFFKEQVVKYKFSYWESKYAKMANGYLGSNSFNRIFKDYNGHTYWVSFPLNNAIFSDAFPEWLNIAIGYGAGGMFGENENITNYNGVEIPHTTRYRRFLLSLDIDWTKIKTDSNILNIILQGMAFIKLPFPAIEFNTKGMIKGHGIYY